MAKLYTLKNGINFIIDSRKGFETVSIVLNVRYGSLYESMHTNGSAHFLEHMLFKGTKKRTWKDISNQTRTLGIYSNASTDFEATNYIMRAYKDYAKSAFDILSDMLINSTLPIDEFEKERGAIINENLIFENNPRNFGYEYLPRALYDKYPAKMPIGGDNEHTIKHITREHLNNIYLDAYVPKNLTLTVYGGISESAALSYAKRYFGVFERVGERKTDIICKEPQRKNQKSFKRAGVTQSRIAIGFKCKGASQMPLEEYIALIIADKLLNNLVYDEIRERNGLSYDPSGACNMWRGFGFICMDAGVEPKDMDKAKSIMLKIITDAHNQNVLDSEVMRAKNQAFIQYKTAIESTLTTAIATSEMYALSADPNRFGKMAKFIKNTKNKKVLQTLSEYLDPNNYVQVTLSPKKNAHAEKTVEE